MLKYYLEYLTEKEREKQEKEKLFYIGKKYISKEKEKRNLNLPTIVDLPDWIYGGKGNNWSGYVYDDPKFWKGFRKNVRPKEPGTRMVLLANGNFYTDEFCSRTLHKERSIHITILSYLIMSGQYPITKNEYLNWFTKEPKRFICLFFDYERYMVPAESYDSEILVKKQLREKWNKIALNAGLSTITWWGW